MTLARAEDQPETAVPRSLGRTVVLLVPALAGLAACLVGLSYVQPPLWHLYALYMLAGLVGVASSTVTYSRVIANWFDRKRGLALGLSSTGTGLGAFIGPSLAQFLIERGGWRLAYLGLAGLTLVVALPVVAIFLRGTPEEVGLSPDGEARPSGNKPEADRTGMTVSEAMRTPKFWLLCGIFFLWRPAGPEPFLTSRRC